MGGGGKGQFPCCIIVRMSTAPSSEHLLTAEEFYLLPDPPHGGKMELVGGEVVVHMPPGGRHGKRSWRIAAKLGAFADAHGLGETITDSGYRLRRDPDTVLGPDVSLVSIDQLPDGEVPFAFIEAIPYLAVEVASPGDTRKEVLEKVGEYLDCGVSRVWVVREKDKTVIVYGQDDQIKVVQTDGVLTSEDAGFSVPGFELKVSEIFG